jgi:hypothetical protein
LGAHLHSTSLKAIVAFSAATVLLPAFALSGVTPIVVKMQLEDLSHTGRVVGRLSGFATAGGLVGTFGTGFVLTARLPTRTILAGIGLALLVLGAVLCWWLQRGLRPGVSLALIGATIAAGGATVAVRGPCKVESGYFCIRVFSVPPDHSGRLLELDDVQNSYIDLRDPRYLGFAYANVIAAATEALVPPGRTIAALHIGGGAFALPRYIAATRPGSTNTVMEIDPAVVDTARRDFGVRTGPNLRVEVGDARVLTRDESPHSYDFVVGDAFSSRSVPWHLTTKQFLAQIRRLLTSNGAYLMNLIDGGQRFVRSESATMRRVFRNVVLFRIPYTHNYVLAASNARVDAAKVTAHAAEDGVLVVPTSGAALRRFIGDAGVLEDDFAPVDQLLR